MIFHWNNHRKSIRPSVVPVLLTLFLLSTGLSAAPVILEGTILNGTTGHPAKARNLTVYSMDDSMEMLERKATAGDHFQFRIQKKVSSYLLTGEYGGQVFFTTISEGNYRKANLTVYEDGAKESDLKITSMHIATRIGSGLSMETLYVVSNHSKPAKTYNTSRTSFLLPDGAENVEAFFRLESVDVAIPLDVTRAKDGSYGIDLSLRPGNGTLTFRYVIKGDGWKDSLPDIESGNRSLDSGNFRIVSWKPMDARPEVIGGKATEITVPHLGSAFRVEYTPGSKVEYRFNSKGIFTPGGGIHRNPFPSGPVEIFLTSGILMAALFLAIHLFLFLDERKEGETTVNQDTKNDES